MTRLYFPSIFLLIIGMIIVVIIVSNIYIPASPEETFKKDPSIIEYCYVVFDTKDMPVSNGRETRMVSTTLVQKVCVDRNLTVISSTPFDNSHSEAYKYWHKNTEVVFKDGK